MGRRRRGKPPGAYVITAAVVCYATLTSGIVMCTTEPMPVDAAVTQQVKLNELWPFDPRTSEHTPWFIVPAMPRH